MGRSPGGEPREASHELREFPAGCEPAGTRSVAGGRKLREGSSQGKLDKMRGLENEKPASRTCLEAGWRIRGNPKSQPMSSCRTSSILRGFFSGSVSVSLSLYSTDSSLVLMKQQLFRRGLDSARSTNVGFKCHPTTGLAGERLAEFPTQDHASLAVVGDPECRRTAGSAAVLDVAQAGRQIVDDFDIV